MAGIFKAYDVRGTVPDQVNETIAKAKHATFAEPKTGANFLVFGESAGFRNVKIVK